MAAHFGSLWTKARNALGRLQLHHHMRARLFVFVCFALTLILGSCTSPGLQQANRIEISDIRVRQVDLGHGASEEGVPLDGATVSGTIELLIGSAEEFVEVQYYLDGSNQAALSDAPPFIVLLDTNALSAGQHKLDVVLARSSYTHERLTVTFIVNNGSTAGPGDGFEHNLAPAILLAKSKNGIVGERLSLVATVTDDGKPQSKVSVLWTVDAGPGHVSLDPSTSASTSVEFSTAGTYKLRISASDGELDSDAVIVVEVEEAVSEEEPSPPTESPTDPKDGEFGAPIRITSGGVYSGRWASHDPKVPAVLIDTSEPVIIENSVIKGPGHLISTDFHKTTNLTVRNTYGFGQNPNVYGETPGRFIHVESFSQLVAENNYLEGTSGIYVHRWLGNGSVSIRFNRAKNIVGLWSDGHGSWLTGPAQFDYAQFVQFNNVHAISNAEIAWNEVINEPGISRTEDVVSLHDSSGTRTSPIRVHNNFIRGSYPALPTEQGFSGGGIMLGDGGGQYQVASNNHVVSVANYGVAIAGGSHNLIEANRILSSGVVADGDRIHASNVGIYIWNQYPHPFEDNRGVGNTVGYVQVKDDGTRVRNDWWVPDATGWSGNARISGPITQAIEMAEYEDWLLKSAAAGVKLGVTN